jgi:type II secretory pathway component GspD/PulD (secretin)
MLFGASLIPWAQSQSTAATAQNQAKNQADIARAEQAYLAGARLLDGHDLAGAQAAFARAAKLNPTRADYGMAFTLTREHRVSELVQSAAKARMLGQAAQADTLLAKARSIDPTDELVLEHPAGSQQAQEPPKATFIPSHQSVLLPAIQIAPQPGDKTVDLRGDARTVIQQTAAAFGLKTAFDSSVTSEPTPQFRFDMENSPYNRTMPLLLKMTHMFAVAVAPKTLLIARDTQENRARLERQVEETVYVPGSNSEQLNELTNIIKSVFDVKQVAVGASSGTILVRAPETTISALNETLADLIDGAAEVMLETRLVSIARTNSVNTGLQTPTSVNVFNAYSEASSLVSANQSLVSTLISSGGYVPTGNNFTDTIAEALLLLLSGAVTDAKLTGLFAVFGNGTSGLTGLSLGSGATFNFALGSSDTRALDDVTVRVGDRQTATLKVGQKYPITTATYSSGVSSSTASALAGVTVNGVSASSLLSQYLGSSAANTTIPQVQYEDLGITLKTTPTVLRSGMINLQIDLKIWALTGGNLDNIPILNSEDFVSDITVPDGASAVMISDLSKTESASISGLPGLGELPGFQESAADDLRETNASELVLLITPHVVSRRKDLAATRRIPFSTSVPPEF